MEQEEIIDGTKSKSKSPLMVSLKWGAIAAIINVIYAIAQYLLTDGFHKPSALDWIIQIAIIIFALIMASNEHKNKELGGVMSYGRGVGIGALFGIVFGILISIWVIYYMDSLVDPVEMQNAQLEELEKNRERLANRGIEISDADIEKQLQMQKKFQTPLMLTVFTTLMMTLLSVVMSLITSIFTKSKSRN